MAGGGSLLRGIDRLVAEETGLPVHVADDPLTAVAEGTGRVLQELQFLKRVASEASFDRQIVQFAYVPTPVELQPGQTLTTSGDGGVFPKGIPIGRIIDVQTNRFGLYLEARVRLAANLNRLEEVWVIFP
jgi:hypothetical protein